MKSFACALLATCALAVKPASVTVEWDADTPLMKVTGSITHTVEGTGATQVLNENISMAIKMLEGSTNEDSVALPFSYMCQTPDLSLGKSNCYEIRYEREEKQDKVAFGVRIREYSVATQEEVKTQKDAMVFLDSPGATWESFPTPATKIGEIEAMTGKDDGPFAVRSGKDL